MPSRAMPLLSTDALAGLVVGIATLIATPYLADWYGWSKGFVLFMGGANVVYGCWSGMMTLRLRRTARLSRWMVFVLVYANGAWGVQCVVQMVRLRESATYLGLGHLFLEALFVGGLAIIEAKALLPAATEA